MKRLVATIIAVPQRFTLAEEIRAACAKRIGAGNVRLFLSGLPVGRASANANLWNALDWQKSQDADWNLFLEDDQQIYPGCFERIPGLLSLADELGVDAFYLANRRVPFVRQELHRNFVLNRLQQPVMGSHGLLYRRADLHAWARIAEGALRRPIDGLFFTAVQPQTRVVYQVVAPIMMQHVGVTSTLHEYPKAEHLALNGVEPTLLCPIR